jgi:hypothetical protein
MSYSVEFYAVSSQSAIQLLKEQHSQQLPETELLKLICALRNIRGNPAVYVMAKGHLCDSPSSHASSWGDWKVQPIEFWGASAQSKSA